MISVIIPIYNGEDSILNIIRYLQNQQLTNFEVLLVNDGSTDHTRNICAAVEKSDPRFHLVNQPNSGVSAARNHGLQLAKGDFITFIDVDDQIGPEYLECLYQSLTEHQADISVCDVSIIKQGKERNRFTCGTEVLSKEEALNLLLSRRQINSGPCAKLFRRDVLEQLCFPSLKVYEDILFVLDAFCQCKRIAATQETAYVYIQSECGAMGKLQKCPSHDVITATATLLKFLIVHKELDPYCFYITISHLMQYVQEIKATPTINENDFIHNTKKLYRHYILHIVRCPSFPWKEKILYLLFSFGIYSA